MNKKEFVKGSIVETVGLLEVPVTLISDMERFSNGYIPFGYSLATFQHEGKEGNVVGAGLNLAVHINGRTWDVPLQSIIELALKADEQCEARPATPTQEPKP